MRRLSPLPLLLLVLAVSGSGGIGACSIGVPACDFHSGGQGERRYDVRGQILAIDKDQGTVTIRHQDIKGFMPAMTMPFKVQNKRLLEGRQRGDLVKATLVVNDTDAYLVTLDVTGHGAVPETPAGDVAAAAPRPLVPVLSPGDPIGDIRLTAADGRTLQFSSLRGSVVALTFVYTRCPLPQFCPRLDRQFAEVTARLRGDERLRASVRLLSISFDPEYDTPAVLAAHGRAIGADGVVWTLATAGRPDLDAFAGRFGLRVMREADNSITHNMRTAIVDRGGRLVNILDGSDWTVDQMMADLRKAAGTT